MMAEVAQSIIPTKHHWEFNAADGLIAAFAMFPNGRQMVTGSSHKTLRLWDLQTGAVPKKMKGHHSAVKAVAVLVSGDSRLIASGDENG